MFFSSTPKDLKEVLCALIKKNNPSCLFSGNFARGSSPRTTSSLLCSHFRCFSASSGYSTRREAGERKKEERKQARKKEKEGKKRERPREREKGAGLLELFFPTVSKRMEMFVIVARLAAKDRSGQSQLLVV